MLRDAGPAALGVLLRQGNRFADAEDAVQDALIIAVDSWPARGMPDRPVGWVVRVAQRRLIDRHHRDTARRRREALVISWSTVPIEPTVSEDDSLALLFLCCHAALKPSAAIPLALRAVGGLTTSEIADALLLLTDARCAARTAANGELVPLDRQDRRVWNRPMIAEGLRLLTSALAHHTMGEYQMQAAIAAVHNQATTYAATNWRQLRALYDLLAQRNDNPLVRLNRAVAVAHTDGPVAAMREVHALGTSLGSHHRYHATVGYLHEMADDHDAARHAYHRAALLATNEPERRYLRGKAES